MCRLRPATGGSAAKPRRDAESAEDRPTDLDPYEREEASNEFQAISDGTLTLGPEEMEAYYRLVKWVDHQSFAELQHRATKGLWFTDLHDHPGLHRGQLVAFDIDLLAPRIWARTIASIFPCARSTV